MTSPWRLVRRGSLGRCGLRFGGLLWAIAVAVAPPVHAQGETTPPESKPHESTPPTSPAPASTEKAAKGSARRLLEFSGAFRLAALDIVCHPEPGIDDGGVCVATGDVELEVGDARVLADELQYTKSTQLAIATGAVVLTFPGAALTGSRLTYHADTQTGTIEDVLGYLDQDNASIRAARVERLDPKRLRVEHATFTTCTQPTPYWSFSIGRGVFELGAYAHLRNVAFKVAQVPVFYSPYLIYPIKTGRASGLLFPEFGNSDKLGRSVTVPFYWAVADNIDLMLLGSAYSRVGYGISADLSMLPTWNGRADARAHWIDDRIRRQRRWNLVWRGRQPLGERTRMIVRVEAVSDFDYFTDYETDLLRAAQPQTDSTIDITKQWSWYTLSLRARRQQQFFASSGGSVSLLTGKVENLRLPQLEWRGRSQRLGKSPFYFSFQGSLDRFGKRVYEPPGNQSVIREDDLIRVVDNDWWRADLAPTVRVPLLRDPWGDLEFNLGWRGTYYSATADPDDPLLVTGNTLTRSLLSAGLSFSGPRFQRVFATPGWAFSPKLKHVIEPFVEYRYRPQTATHAEQILRVDSIDDDPAALSDFSYGVRQRFYALRPPQFGPGGSLASASESSFDALQRQNQEAAERVQKEQQLQALGLGNLPELPATQEGPNLSPVEIGSLEIAQSYSLVRPLTQVYRRVLCDDGGGTDPITGRPCTEAFDTRAFSAIRIRARYNPTAEHSVDVAYTLDPANDVLAEASLSTLLRPSLLSYVEGSVYRRRPVDPGRADASTYARTRWGWLTPGQKFGIETQWDYNLESRQMEHQSYRLRYATQCCAFRFGWDRRDFEDNQRREYYLVIDLSGLGKVLDVNY